MTDATTEKDPRRWVLHSERREGQTDECWMRQQGYEHAYNLLMAAEITEETKESTNTILKGALRGQVSVGGTSGSVEGDGAAETKADHEYRGPNREMFRTVVERYKEWMESEGRVVEERNRAAQRGGPELSDKDLAADFYARATKRLSNEVPGKEELLGQLQWNAKDGTERFVYARRYDADPKHIEFVIRDGGSPGTLYGRYEPAQHGVAVRVLDATEVDTTLRPTISRYRAQQGAELEHPTSINSYLANGSGIEHGGPREARVAQIDRSGSGPF